MFYFTFVLMEAPSLFFIDASVDRASETRGDEARLSETQLAPTARYLLLRQGRVKVEGSSAPRVAWHTLSQLDAHGVDRSTVAFLGMAKGEPRFAVIPAERPLSADQYRYQGSSEEENFIGLRRAALTLPAADAQLAAHAAHIANWINRNRYCGSCAAPMRIAEGGHKLICTADGCAREEFPRTDPVVISLVIHENKCLLARQPRFPPKFYSALAGFVEPGETLETAVRREVREEAGLEVGEVRYVGSQPWPFPTSLMIGYVADAKGEAFKLDQRELEDARWFERGEIAKLLTLGPDSVSPVLLPPTGVMARRLIDEWMLPEEQRARS